MQAYHDLVKYVLNRGTTKPARQGIDTIAAFHYSYVHDMRKGFPILTGKLVPWKSIVIENLWFLGGSASPAFLHKHGVRFWDEWIEEDGNLPEAYGKFWRGMPFTDPKLWIDEVCHEDENGIWRLDQVDLLLKELKGNINSRRLVLTNWYPPSAWNAKLPPCHLMSIFNVQYTEQGEPYLNLEMLQRSCDVPVGVPFNMAGYGFLLSLFARLSGLEPRYFGHTLVDAHIYKNQIKPLVGTYLMRDPKPLPTLEISDRIQTLQDVEELIRDGTTDEIMDSFVLHDYNPHPFIKFEVSV